MRTKTWILSLALAGVWALTTGPGVSAQDVAIEDYQVDPTGRVRIQVESDPDHYYVLYFREELGAGSEQAVAMALGEGGSTTLTEQLAAYPVEHYRVAAVPLADPGDIDGDRIDDLEEFANLGRMSPFNGADEIAFRDGTVSIPDRATFEAMSYQGPNVMIDTHLRDLEFVKFYLLEMDTDNPQVYFMNTETHRAHPDFARAVGIDQGRPGRGDAAGIMRGEIVYHPHVISPNGSFGVYRFEFEPNDRFPFADVQRANELIAKNMPVLQNDLAYYPMPNAALPRYNREKELYDASRVAIILDEDIYADVTYVPLNIAEGYGLLRLMDLEERPGSRDIVIYEALPNELPRVGGIITTVPQTPLSHVNLRAKQDNVPNAYIDGALDDPTISDLIGKHVYYRVAETEYEIREATLAEVEEHYASVRPAERQVPVRDLSVTAIADLDDIGFDDWVGFGVKAANMATLRSFGFPEGTVRDGFAVPFYYYDEFMKHNGFYDDVQELLDDPGFAGDYDVQEEMLSDLRDDIEDGDMPQWMLDDLAAMQDAFPEGASIRCRSSTNNEDLPGYTGAGLYDSYTHHEDEGHISKSIKQVYASLWNFRAFDEREFYRIDHLQTAMGVLVHLSFEDELANGVGVTLDPFYGSEGTFYLNTQVGEDLVTNPDALSIAEEILLGAQEGGGYTIVRPSNQVAAGEQVLSEAHLDEMRTYLNVIDEQFRRLYGVGAGGADGSDDGFAMEIEYKITGDDVLAIKQARPWVAYDAGGDVVPTSTPPPGASETPTRTPTPTTTLTPADTGTPTVATPTPTAEATVPTGGGVLHLPRVDNS